MLSFGSLRGLVVLSSVVVACASRVDADGGDGGNDGTQTASATGATRSAAVTGSSSTGLPVPTEVCTSFVAGNDDGGGELGLVELGTGSDMEGTFTPIVDGQTLQMEWGFQGLQHFPFTPRAAYVTAPITGFAEIVPNAGENRGLVQIVFQPCANGWAEVVGHVMIMPVPEAVDGTLKLTIGTCPVSGCDVAQPDYGFTEVLGTKEAQVHVNAPEGPPPFGAGGGQSG